MHWCYCPYLAKALGALIYSNDLHLSVCLIPIPGTTHLRLPRPHPPYISHLLLPPPPSFQLPLPLPLSLPLLLLRPPALPPLLPPRCWNHQAPDVPPAEEGSGCWMLHLASATARSRLIAAAEGVESSTLSAAGQTSCNYTYSSVPSGLLLWPFHVNTWQEGEASFKMERLLLLQGCSSLKILASHIISL